MSEASREMPFVLEERWGAVRGESEGLTTSQQGRGFLDVVLFSSALTLEVRVLIPILSFRHL